MHKVTTFSSDVYHHDLSLSNAAYGSKPESGQMRLQYSCFAHVGKPFGEPGVDESWSILELHMDGTWIEPNPILSKLGHIIFQGC